MKKIFIFYFFFFISISLINSQGIQRLSEKISESITAFFELDNEITFSIVRFENKSSLTDLEVQRFYHLIATPLEKNKNVIFKDILTGFNDGKGNFDLSRINEVNHIISIKMINNYGKLGAGIVIYNRNNNKIIYVKYFEEMVPLPEIELLGIKNPGISSKEYIKELDLRVAQNVLNLSILNISGSQYIFFLTDNKIEVYEFKGNSLIKINSQEIEWGRPNFPAKKNEGSLFLLKDHGKIYLFAGSNFSKYTMIFKFENVVLQKIARMDFSPLDLIKLNGVNYLAGFNYNFGKNFFEGKLYLKHFNTDKIEQGEVYIKELPDFYSASFYKESDEFKSLILIDKDYKLRIFSNSMSEVSGRDIKYGSAISVDGKLVGLSDYTRINDNFKILKIGDNFDVPLFSGEIDGEITLLKKGLLNGKNGFWMIIENVGKGLKRSRLQFWRKNID